MKLWFLIHNLLKISVISFIFCDLNICQVQDLSGLFSQNETILLNLSFSCYIWIFKSMCKIHFVPIRGKSSKPGLRNIVMFPCILYSIIQLISCISIRLVEIYLSGKKLSKYVTFYCCKEWYTKGMVNNMEYDIFFSITKRPISSRKPL